MEEADLIDRLKKAFSGSDEPYVFTRKEVKEIQAVLKVYRTIMAMKGLGQFILWGIAAAALLISNIDKIKEFFK